MPAAERTLSQRELNRALLERQMLLRRSRVGPARALERMGGLQAQYAPSTYIGLWSRLEGLERRQVTRAIERRTVTQGTLMRATIHLVSSADYWPFSLGVRAARRRVWLRSHRPVTAAQMEGAARKLRGAFSEGPLRRSEIDGLIGRPRAAGINLWLDLVRVPPSGTWERRRADLYLPAEHWLGAPEGTAEEGVERLVRRYLQGFGPATVPEIADWAGLAPKEVSPVVERLGVRRFWAADGDALVDLPRAPLPDPQTPAPVRFLPVWDAALLVHARRAGVLPEQYRARVFNTRTPHSVHTFLVNGMVAGTWHHERDRIQIEPFSKLDRAARRAVEEEAARLAELHR